MFLTNFHVARPSAPYVPAALCICIVYLRSEVEPSSRRLVAAGELETVLRRRRSQAGVLLSLAVQSINQS